MFKINFLLVTIILFTNNAYSYRLNNVANKGARWKKLPINMKMNADNSGLPEQDVRNVIQSAMDKWNTNTTKNVLSLESKKSNKPASQVIQANGEHTIGFSKNFSNDSLGFDPDVIVAVAGQYGNGKEMNNAFLLFNAEAVNWTTDENTGDSRSLYSDDLASIAGHELGHVIGLGHSEHPDAIMSTSRSSKIKRELTQDDIDGANFLLSNSSQDAEGSGMSFAGCGSIKNINNNDDINSSQTLVLILMLIPFAIIFIIRKKYSQLLSETNIL